MINKSLLDGLKVYKTNSEDTGGIAIVFPLVLGNILRLITITLPPCYVKNLTYDVNKFMEFQLCMGNAIRNHDFDVLDNIILEFFKSYHFMLPPHKFCLEFPQKVEETFITTCNNFKGKKWNDILGLFMESLYELLLHGTVNGIPINLGT